MLMDYGMKTVHLQPISSIIRVFDDNKEYSKDEYEWVAFVRWIDDDKVEIIGTMTAPTLSQWRAMSEFFKSRKIKVIIKRVRSDGSKETRDVV